jgi:hypothetical protein
MLLGLQGVDEDQKQRLKFLPLNLSSMKACVEAARAFALIEERLDVVVANAALSIMVIPFRGLSRRYGVNDHSSLAL